MNDTLPSILIQHVVPAAIYSTRYVPDKARLADLKWVEDPLSRAALYNRTRDDTAEFWKNWQFSHPQLTSEKPVCLSILINPFSAYYDQAVIDAGFMPRIYKQNDCLLAAARGVIYQNMLEHAPLVFKRDAPEAFAPLLTLFKDALKGIVGHAEASLGTETVQELQKYIGNEFASHLQP